MKEVRRTDLIEHLREEGYTDDELQAMDTQELIREANVITDEELKLRRDFF